jgi:Acetyltransferase (GNAT) family
VIGNSSRRNLITQAVREHHGYIARREQQVIGFLLLHHHFFGYPFIDLLIVHPFFRRQHIGTALMQHIEPIYTPGKCRLTHNLAKTGRYVSVRRINARSARFASVKSRLTATSLSLLAGSSLAKPATEPYHRRFDAYHRLNLAICRDFEQEFNLFLLLLKKAGL